jgi:quinol monooxygenase YgiN
MIIIAGSLVGTADTIDELIALSLAHVRRSRAEPGCLAHGVARDVENPLRLVFTERWIDMAAVMTHFAVQESGEFVRSAISLSEQPPTLELFEAATVTTGSTATPWLP